ncbi:MAG: tyrosine-type recombinase/integrase [Bacteroidales bacterium]|nr:tyrosine-type recombinase/integrase [Bacteroidales bacterium]
MAIIGTNYVKTSIINPTILRSNRRLQDGLIAPASEFVSSDIAADHAAEPIKNMEDINRISRYLVVNKRYRDNMLFIVGINFGLRASDLRMLRFSNIINENCTFRDSFPVFERKTRNTRKRKKNRYITINQAVMEAIILYLENTPDVSLSDYMFRSVSNNGGNLNEPISVRSIDRILKGIASDLELNVKMSTHSLRKTFCYHQMLMSHNDSRKLMLLQKMLGHASPAQTLDYIGLTGEEIEEAYRALNLGSIKHNYLVDSSIVEYEDSVG